MPTIHTAEPRIEKKREDFPMEQKANKFIVLLFWSSAKQSVVVFSWAGSANLFFELSRPDF